MLSRQNLTGNAILVCQRWRRNAWRSAMSHDIHENQPERTPKSEGKAFSKDIGPLLKGWDYEPGTINVRKINGADGSPKLQMRLDLGLLQMELTGRPDGAKPHGHDSLLEYF